jgi:hypothetical protein
LEKSLGGSFLFLELSTYTVLTKTSLASTVKMQST